MQRKKTNSPPYFVTAIGTDSGKTLFSAILCRALTLRGQPSTYWKPIQAGYPTDSQQIASWLGSTQSIHQEAYLLAQASAPEEAAAAQGIKLSVRGLKCPNTPGPLVIEGAGGLLVPLEKDFFVLDLIKQLQAKPILVINTYLGCINHTLLSLRALKQANLSPLSIVLNGKSMAYSETVIQEVASCPCILRIPQLKEVNLKTIDSLAQQLCLP